MSRCEAPRLRWRDVARAADERWGAAVADLPSARPLWRPCRVPVTPGSSAGGSTGATRRRR